MTELGHPNRPRYSQSARPLLMPSADMLTGFSMLWLLRGVCEPGHDKLGLRLVARLRRADVRKKCPKLGVDRK